ncbi:hypothetical protein OIU79_002759 [Salix purpurea]|uniref:Uncharacterized protein n=1 Tax=Salix purpurea TaxID=77065 RepID=A0A9Q0UJW6_SALPP|nr:hypothetical protein OIU79_002759 [Salix purpurea]
MIIFFCWEIWQAHDRSRVSEFARTSLEVHEEDCKLRSREGFSWDLNIIWTLVENPSLITIMLARLSGEYMFRSRKSGIERWKTWLK